MVKELAYIGEPQCYDRGLGVVNALVYVGKCQRYD